MIQYIRGDATKPIDTGGVRVITHIVNSAGGWGAGFVVALSKRWKTPESRYRKWFKEGAGFELGEIQLVLVEDEPDHLWVANMIAQVGYGRRGSAQHKSLTLEEPDRPPIRYEALRACLEKVAEQAKRRGATIHAPRLGSGLAGGDWSIIEKIIEDTLCAVGVEVFIYDLPASQPTRHSLPSQALTP